MGLFTYICDHCHDQLQDPAAIVVNDNRPPTFGDNKPERHFCGEACVAAFYRDRVVARGGSLDFS